MHRSVVQPYNSALLTMTVTQINCVTFAPDGRHVATGGSNGVTRVWLPELLPKDVKRAEHTYVVVFGT